MKQKGKTAAPAAFLTLLLLLVSASAPAGAPPGDWKEVRTTYFRFAYHPGVEEHALPVIDEADKEVRKLKGTFGLEKVEPIEVRIARNTVEMEEVKPGAPPPSWAVGMALRGKRMILLSLTPPGGGKIGGIRELFVHELVHVLTYDAAGRLDLPIWFNEGIAIRLSGEFSFARHRTLLGAALRNELLPISKLDNHYPDHGRKVNIAYAQSADLVGFILKRYGKDKPLLPELFRRLGRGDEFESALQSICRRSMKQIENEWLQSLNVHYKWVPSLTGGSALWGFITVLLVVAYVRRARKAKANLKRMELEEEFFNLSHGSLVVDERDKTKNPKRTEDLKKVFHEGRFHTLH
jgi:hypothetical protein